MTSLRISLSDELRTFVDQQVRGGGYHDHGEYIRSLIQDDQTRRARDRVDALLVEGLASGEPSAMTADDWQAIRAQVRDVRRPSDVE